MQKFLQDFSVPAVFAGFITFLIGISVSAVLVIQAAQVLGATPAQITSWFWALGLGIGLSGLILSWKFGGVSKSMLKKSRLDFDKIGKCE